MKKMIGLVLVAAILSGCGEKEVVLDSTAPEAATIETSAEESSTEEETKEDPSIAYDMDAILEELNVEEADKEDIQVIPCEEEKEGGVSTNTPENAQKIVLRYEKDGNEFEKTVIATFNTQGEMEEIYGEEISIISEPNPDDYPEDPEFQEFLRWSNEVKKEAAEE